MPKLAFNRYKSAVQRNYPLHYRKAEPCAASAAGTRLVHAVKSFKKVRYCVLRYAYARILHNKLRLAPGLLHRRVNMPGVCILDCVFYKIYNGLLYLAFLAKYHCAAAGEIQRYALVLCKRLQSGNNALCYVLQINVFPVQQRLTFIELHKAQKIRYNVGHSVYLVVNILEELPHFGRVRIFLI